MAAPPSTPMLRLIATDEADLEAVSAAVQDAVLRRAEIEYDARRRRLTLGLRRYLWERAVSGSSGPGRRAAAALDVSGVLSVRSKGIGEANGVLSLLAVRFEPAAEPPGGAVRLLFAGGGEIRADVECLDVLLVDLTRPWLAAGRPRHPSDEA